MSVEFNQNVPIYKQIMDIIKRRIISSKIMPGDKLPSIREMSVELQVNPNTVQRTYQELEREGITYTQRGTGNFVKEDIEMVKKLKEQMAEDLIEGFIDGMRNLGFQGSEIIEIVEKKVQNININKQGEI